MPRDAAGRSRDQESPGASVTSTYLVTILADLLDDLLKKQNLRACDSIVQILVLHPG